MTIWTYKVRDGSMIIRFMITLSTKITEVRVPYTHNVAFFSKKKKKKQRQDLLSHKRAYEDSKMRNSPIGDFEGHVSDSVGLERGGDVFSDGKDPVELIGVGVDDLQAGDADNVGA